MAKGLLEDPQLPAPPAGGLLDPRSFAAVDDDLRPMPSPWLQVPPDSLTDAPVFLRRPDVGDETTTDIPSSRQLLEDRLIARGRAIIEEMKALENNPTMDLSARLRRTTELFNEHRNLLMQSPSLLWSQRRDQASANVPDDVRTMLDAIERRRALGRQDDSNTRDLNY